jgi:hypothetical protein
VGWTILPNEIPEGTLLIGGFDSDLIPLAAGSLLLKVNMQLENPADTSVALRVQGDINGVDLPLEALALQTFTVSPGLVEPSSIVWPI